MSLSALSRAVRNHLRTNLTDFYNNTDAPTQVKHRKANCRVMVNEHPTADCGQEFIAIYGTSHRPTDPDFHTAIEESFGLTVAVTRKIARVPKRARGEAGYIEDDDFSLDWVSIEARCRHIVGLIDKNYTLMQAANALMDVENGFIVPLRWVGSDPQPQEVDAAHFCAWHSSLGVRPHATITPLPPAPEADEVYGLLMKVRFDGAIRFQPNSEYDTALTP